MRITDTLSDSLEEFNPEDPVRMYYCGLTVSDSPHLGHARGWIHTDVLRRLLEYKGYDVQHIENITDVNEKIFKRLGEENIDADSEQELADKFSRELLKSKNDLNLRRATAYPRVSNHIDEIISTIQSLIEEGSAYESNGSVYFNVSDYDDYGKLSNQSLEGIESQGDEDLMGEKRSNNDFALWKAVKPSKTRGETWESPWGHGRPGWHIECSVMSSVHLDLPIDIHIGGQDLVFPHHENEIAQSESIKDTQFARKWMHVRLLNNDNDSEKMSSSRGNFKTVQSAIDDYGANPIRWFILSSNYDSNQTYSEDKLRNAESKWTQVKKTHKMLVKSLGTSKSSATHEDQDLRDKFSKYEESIVSYLSDDLNTRKSLVKIREVAQFASDYIENNDLYDQGLIMEILDFYKKIVEQLLGFSIEDNERSLDVEQIADYRDDLRENGQFEESDAIRDALEEAGYVVEDTDDGTLILES